MSISLANNAMSKLFGLVTNLSNEFVTMQQDQFERLLPTFIQVIDLMEQEESEYWAVVSAVLEGKPVDSIASKPSLDSVASTSLEASINNKVSLQIFFFFKPMISVTSR